MASAKNKLRNHRILLFVKIVMLAQVAVILFSTVGMYQEYLNNSYLQDYVVNLFRSTIAANAMLSMITVSVCEFARSLSWALCASDESTKN